MLPFYDTRFLVRGVEFADECGLVLAVRGLLIELAASDKL